MRGGSAVAIVLACLMVAACGGSSDDDADAASKGTASSSSTPESTPIPAPPRCMPETEGAEAVDIPATDGGARLAGVIAGEGPRSLLLIHGTSSNGRCAWEKEVPALAAEGFRVLAIDLACVGDSDCPEDISTDDSVRDIASSVAFLRAGGASSVAVVGASYGTAPTIIAAGAPDVDADAFIALSPGRFDDTIRPENAPKPRTVMAARKTVHAPMLYVVARSDQLSSVPRTRQLHRATAAKGSELAIVAGGHAQSMLYPEDALFADPPGGPIWQRVLTFLDGHLT